MEAAGAWIRLAFVHFPKRFSLNSLILFPIKGNARPGPFHLRQRSGECMLVSNSFFCMLVSSIEPMHLQR
jgi:hypothetical protein